MSYSNYHHNRQQTSQPFHHRGVLTKLTSSTSSSSSVGTFSSIAGGGGLNTLAGGGGGKNGGLAATRATGAGLGVARNVPKLVNTSSLRKENGGQDITAVLVNRHGGKKSGWGSAITTPATKSKKDSSSTTSSIDDDQNKSNDANDNANNNNSISNDKATHGSEHDKNTNHHDDDHHQHSMSSTFSGPTPEEAFIKRTDHGTNSSSDNNHYHGGGGGGHDSKPSSSYHHHNHPPWNSSGSGGGGMNHDSSYPSDRDYHRDYHGSGGNNYQPSHNHYHNDRSLTNDDFPPFGSNDKEGGLRQSPPPNGPPSQYQPMRNYGRYNDSNYPPSSSSSLPSGNLYDDQNDYRHQSHHSHRLYHNSRRQYNNEYYRGDSSYYNNDRFGSGGGLGGGGGNYQDSSSSRNVRLDYDQRRSSFDNDRYGSSSHHNHHHQNSFYNHHNNMDYDRGGYNSGGGSRRFNNYHSSSPFDQERNHSRLFGGRSHYDQHLPPQRSDFGRNRDDFGVSSREGSGVGDDDHHGFASDHRNYLQRSNSNRDSSMNYSVDKKIIEEEGEGQNDDERSNIAPKQILRHKEPSFCDSNNDSNNDRSVIQTETSHDPPQLTDEKGDYSTSSALSVPFTNKRIETPSEKERRVRLLKQQQENILRQVEATRAELARKKQEERIKVEEQEKEQLRNAQEQEHSNQLETAHKVNPIVNEKIEEKSIDKVMTVEVEEEEKNSDENGNSNSTMDKREIKDAVEKPVLDEEAIQKLKEEFYSRMAAERKARANHRRRRKPRTRGVLFKRLPDGSIVNADLSEEEVAKRAEKKMHRKEARDNGDTPFRNRKLQNNSKAKKSRNNQDTKSSKDEKDESEKKEKKKFMPSPGPTESAWIAGPPAGMKASKSTLEKQEETMNSETEAKGFSNDNSTKTVDQVLSAGLLDIGNNGNATSWSADTSQPKVAMGPIMSSWSAFSGNGGTVGFDSFGTKSAENTGVDWNMDFALPHDLLSNAVDSEEDAPSPPDKSTSKDDNAEPSSAPPITKKFNKSILPKRDFNKKFNKKPGNSNYNPNHKGKHPRSYGGRGFKRNNPRYDNRHKESDTKNKEAEASTN